MLERYTAVIVHFASIVDTRTVLLKFTISYTDRGPIHEFVATPYLDLQPMTSFETKPTAYSDSGTESLKLIPSGTEHIPAIHDAGTVHLSLAPSSVDVKVSTDAATVYLDISVADYCEVIAHESLDLEFFATVEWTILATKRWEGNAFKKWTSQYETTVVVIC